jgi:hypothetical protein
VTMMAMTHEVLLASNCCKLHGRHTGVLAARQDGQRTAEDSSKGRRRGEILGRKREGNALQPYSFLVET